MVSIAEYQKFNLVWSVVGGLLVEVFLVDTGCASAAHSTEMGSH